MNNLRQLSPGKLTRYYTGALLLIGCLALGSHMAQLSASRNIAGLAAIITVSGRQRMLSQRIASLAAQLRLGDVSVRPDLEAAITEFESAHNRLSHGDLADDSSPNDPRLIQQLYFDGPHSVDAEMRAFLSNARQVAALAPNDPALPALLAGLFAASRAPLLNDLNRIVAIRQHESEAKFNRLRSLQWIILTIMLMALLLEAQYIFRPMVIRIVDFSGEILRLASTDSLTGVANRRGFFKICASELARARRSGQPLSMLLLDIDHFKQINDTYGHAAGDLALKTLSETLRRSLRPSDVLGRVGGEEFAILAPETGITQSAQLAERLRSEIEALRIPQENDRLSFTISLGVAEVGSDPQAIEVAMQAADRLMYRAKESGRNRVFSSQLARNSA